jgi:hypothetical protein
MNNQVNNSVKEVFECVMLSDLPVMTKFKLTEVLTVCEREQVNEDEALKVVVSKKRGNNTKNVFGNKRWEDEDRMSLFKQVKAHFGSANTWSGRVTPPVGKRYNEVVADLAVEFGRTPGSIKAQIHDVVSNTYTDKNEPSIRKAKKVAMDIGLITTAMYNN